MIGQKRILQWVDLNINNFPRFIVLIAPKGCGKRLMAKTIAEKLSATYSEVGIKVDEIRDVIRTAYTVSDKTLYCIADADTMRNEAKNSMLKVTEEPPKNAYFVLTLQDDSTLLETLRSRAYVINLEPYSKNELKAYCELKGISTEFVDIATNPYQIEDLSVYGKELDDFVDLVLDNIAEVEPANAFKSSSKLALKSDSKGYDLQLFFSMFMQKCLSRIEDDVQKYALGILVTRNSANEVGRLGVNRQHIYDMWVLNIREAWY